MLLLILMLSQTERENHLPVSEDEFSTPGFLRDDRNEFIYGLGETNGPLEKSQGRKFTLEGRDALSYGWEHGASAKPSSSLKRLPLIPVQR